MLLQFLTRAKGQRIIQRKKLSFEEAVNIIKSFEQNQAKTKVTGEAEGISFGKKWDEYISSIRKAYNVLFAHFKPQELQEGESGKSYTVSIYYLFTQKGDKQEIYKMKLKGKYKLQGELASREGVFCRDYSRGNIEIIVRD